MGNTDADLRPEAAGQGSGAGAESQSQAAENGEVARPPLQTYEDLARMIDLGLLAPDLSEEEVSRGCDVARKYRIGFVTLRPCDVQLASQWLGNSGVVPVAAVSYPHGAATTAVKNYETRDMLQRGAKAIETPLAIGKLKSRSFQYLETEIIQIVTECRRAGASVTLDIEVASLALDLRVIACRIARRTEVDRVRAAALHPGSRPAPEDLAFLKSKLGDSTALDAGAWVRTLEDAKAAYQAGAVSFQTIDPAPILDAWREELKSRDQQAPCA
jgi:deoxyribose-phosphate aldolase